MESSLAVSPDEGSKGGESGESELDEDEECSEPDCGEDCDKAVLKEVKAKSKVERTVHPPPSINPKGYTGAHLTSYMTIMKYPSAIVLPNKL